MQKPSRNRLIVLAGLALSNLVVWVLAGFFLLQERGQVERRAETLAGNAAEAIEQEVGNSVDKVDLALRWVIDELEHDLRIRRDPAEIDQLLATLGSRIPYQGLRVTDATGTVMHGGADDRTPAVSYAGREMFPPLRDRSDAGLQLSQPTLGPISRTWVVGFARRYRDAQGRFAGVVSSSVPVAHFTGPLSRFDIGPGGRVSLYRTDLALIARYPAGAGSHPEGAAGPLPRELAGLAGSTLTDATFHWTSPGNPEKQQIVSFHRLGNAPLMVVVSLAGDDYLVPWRQDRLATGLATVGFLLFSLVAALAVLRAVRKVEEKRARLLEVNADLHQLIDEYQVMAEQLKESEQRYSALFANKLNAISHCRVLTDGEGRPVDYLVLKVNEAYERMLRIGAGEIEGRRITEVFPGIGQSPDDYIGTLGKVGLESGEILFETCFPPTGQYFSIYAYSPLPGEFTTIITDITERKKGEEALRVSESKFRIIFDNAIYGILIFETETGRILDVNEAHVAMYGYSREELCSGMRAYDLSAETDASQASVQGIGRSGPSFVPLRYHRKKDGTVFPVEIVGGAYEWNGRRVMFGLVHDITERIRAEETHRAYAQRLLVQEEDLRKKVSSELHDDIGQHLTALGLNLAYLDSNLRGSQHQELRPALEDLRLLAREISSSVRSLLADLRPSQLEDYGVAAALCSYAVQYRQRTGLAVEVEIDPEFPRLQAGQEIALFRIAQEALNNVAKYAGATNVTLSLRSLPELLELRVSDDGQGFVPAEAVPQPAGSGWGLTIMRERAQLAGGACRVLSIPGAGTTVLVSVRRG